MRRIIKQQLAHGRGIEMLAHLIGDNKGEEMSFEYDPEMASAAWADGSYEATITKVEESLSKKDGDPMLIVSYDVYGAPGGPTRNQKTTLKDYITAPPPGSGRKGSLFKLRAIAEALGLSEKFKAKTLRPKELVGKNLVLVLTREESAQFGDQNRIASYARLDRQPVAAGVSASGKADDDPECPF